jgi:hypothetical protein
MGVQGCRAVRTNHLQVLQAVVVGDAVDVVEDHGHASAPPKLALTAQFTDRLLETRR